MPTYYPHLLFFCKSIISAILWEDFFKNFRQRDLSVSLFGQRQGSDKIIRIRMDQDFYKSWLWMQERWRKKWDSSFWDLSFWDLSFRDDTYSAYKMVKIIAHLLFVLLFSNLRVEYTELHCFPVQDNRTLLLNRENIWQQCKPKLVRGTQQFQHSQSSKICIQ